MKRLALKGLNIRSRIWKRSLNHRVFTWKIPFTFLVKLFKYVKCKNVVILSQSSKLHLGNHRALESDNDVLRCLQTTKYKEQYSSNATTTEKGVLIGELPAACE